MTPPRGAWCCVLSCLEEAVWNIDNETEDSAQGCTKHVGELLASGSNHVYPIPLGVTL